MHRGRFVLSLVLLLATAWHVGSARATTYAGDAAAAGPFSVVGNRIVNGHGQPFFLHGVDWPSLDWSCGGQYADGSRSGIAAGEFAAMRADWHANSVRIPLNQDLWLAGSSRYCSSYAATVAQVVRLVEVQGMVPVLDLHSSDGGNLGATSDTAQCMADRNSLAFWHAVATAYGSDRRVMFELYNEPHDVPWPVWRDGGSFTCVNGQTYVAAGMQQLADTVRAAGALNVVLAGGNSWAGDLSGATTRLLDGPNIAYAVHPYSDTDTVDTSLWDSRFGRMTALAPVVATEFGRSGCPSSYSPTFDRALLSYFHAHGVGYTAWAWWVGGCSFPSIIGDEAGHCFQGGCVFQSDMAALDARRTLVTVPARTVPVFGFETGVAGWAGSRGSLSTCTCAPAYDGRFALRVPLPRSASTTAASHSGLTGLGTGSYVTAHVLAPTGSAVTAVVGVWDATGRHASAPRRLQPGWNTLTYPVPSVRSLRAVGVTASTGAWSGAIAVDDVTWTPALPAAGSLTDFEDGTTDGWSPAWGTTLQTASTTDLAWSGTHALAVDVTGAGYPAIAQRAGLNGLTGLTAGQVVTLHVYAPAGATVSVQPWVWDAAWHTVSGPTSSLSAGWNTVTWQVPAGTSTPTALGLQVNDGAGWTGRLAVDAVTH